MVVVLVVPCPLALRVWWSWHSVDVCGRWWLTGLQGLGAAVRWWWWALVVVVVVGAIYIYIGRRRARCGPLCGPRDLR